MVYAKILAGKTLVENYINTYARGVLWSGVLSCLEMQVGV